MFNFILLYSTFQKIYQRFYFKEIFLITLYISCIFFSKIMLKMYSYVNRSKKMLVTIKTFLSTFTSFFLLTYEVIIILAKI